MRRRRRRERRKKRWKSSRGHIEPKKNKKQKIREVEKRGRKLSSRTEKNRGKKN